MNEDDDEVEDTSMGFDREESPTPAERPPSPAAFRDLSIQAQFAYVKPVIRAIMNNTYEPASKRHKDFMNKKTRQGLRTQSGGIGDFSVPEFHQLGKIVQHWLVPKTTVIQASSTTLVLTSDGPTCGASDDQFANAVKSAVLVSHWL